MSTYGDSQRSIAAWLEAEAPDRAPTRLIETSRDRVRATPQRTSWWSTRKGPNRNAFATVAVAAAAVVVLAVGVAGLAQQNGPSTGPAVPSPSPTVQPTTQPSVAAPSPAAGEGVLGTQWPANSRLAQERADAGDPAYAWLVDPALDLVHGDRGWSLHADLTTPAIIDRFLREVLGWDAYLFNTYESNPSRSEIGIDGLVYIRCAPGQTNPLYPTADRDAPGAERCAPTLDGSRHESVGFVLQQPERKDKGGVWAVDGWALTEPFTEVDPGIAETEVTARLEAWLDARVAGHGADGTVATEDDRGDGRCNGRYEAMCRIDDVPLLYASTSGARYERYEIQRTGGPRWPYAEMEFVVRLSADRGRTEVEQPVAWIDRQRWDGRGDLGFLSLVTAMTENGRPVAVPFVFLDGKLTVIAARPWKVSHQGWNFGLNLDDQEGGGESITFVPDPFLFTTRRFVGPNIVDAASLLDRIQSDPALVATAPVDVTVGGTQGVYVDITLAPGADVYRDEDGHTPVLHSSVAYPYTRYGTAGWGANIDPDSRMRLYLIDLPEGSSNRMWAIAIGAPASRFQSVVEAAAPVLDSIEFHAP